MATGSESERQTRDFATGYDARVDPAMPDADPPPALADTSAQPADWLPYRLRAAFNLFELACLLNRVDPERCSSAAFDEVRQHNRQIGMSRSADKPAHIIGLINAIPDRVLGDPVGETLKALKKAVGTPTMNAPVTTEVARTLAAGLGLTWPAELDSRHPGTEDAATSPPAEPLDAELKKSALIGKYVDRWPTIERDLRDAPSNGLREAAKGSRHGWWREQASLRWAEPRGKLLQQLASPASVFHRVR